MGEISLGSLNMTRDAKERETQRQRTRKRNLMVLINRYLIEQGCIETAETLRDESSVNLDVFVLCDNIDLEMILQEFEVFYYAKFCKYPQIAKKLSTEELNELDDRRRHNKPKNTGRRFSIANCSISSRSQNGESGKNKEMENTKQSDLCVEGKLFCDEQSKLFSDAAFDNRPKLPRPDLFSKYNEEWNELVKIISKDIYQGNPNVKWDDILGLDEVKELIKEALVYPVKYPDLFHDILSPWKGLLLYGPPGTGKTMLAKAVATECHSTFFNVSSSTVISKWRGDSEKLIRVLFELARFHAPSTIFLDEIDSLMSHRENVSGHESSRRMKTEFFIQMDGLAYSDDLVFVLAASNLPWELDNALLRRLQKRILVPIPNNAIRIALFKKFLPPGVFMKSNVLCISSNLDYEILAENTDGYSGDDIKIVCKEAVMNCLRKVFLILEQHKKDGTVTRKLMLWTCASFATRIKNYRDIRGQKLPEISLPPIVTSDVLAAISHTKSSVGTATEKYNSWHLEFGST